MVGTWQWGRDEASRVRTPSLPHVAPFAIVTVSSTGWGCQKTIDSDRIIKSLPLPRHEWSRGRERERALNDKRNREKGTLGARGSRHVDEWGTRHTHQC